MILFACMGKVFSFSYFNQIQPEFVFNKNAVSNPVEKSKWNMKANNVSLQCNYEVFRYHIFKAVSFKKWIN